MQHRKVTLKDVGRESGVTIGTVSAIVRGSRDRIFYSDETRDRVLAVVAKLGYRVNPAARSLREGKTRTIGVMLDDITLPFLASLICAVGKALEQHGYSILLCNMNAASAARESLLQIFARGHIDAFMLAGALTRLTDEDILAVHQRGHRVVLLERPAPSPVIDSVGVDNQAGGHLAAAKLLARGCHRLVMVGGPAGNAMSHLRIAGALATCRAAGLPESALTVLESGGWTTALGYESMHRHLAAGHRPDAVFACNDQLAIGAMWALTAHQRAIPDAVAVIGFDDSPMAAFAHPPLTTVRQPVAAMGAAAAELLIAPATADHVGQRLFPPELIERQTT
jgi:LacI family transcriptional regulator